MSDDELDGMTGDGSVARLDRDRRAPRFSWTPAYEATFFRSLCESVSRGLRENNSFKSEAWERAAAALQATHGAFPTKSHLINKSDNARKRFRLWRGLREDPEFLYNGVAKTVTATEEAWRAHIEREPLSRALRGRPFEHEDYMEILYPDVIGSGGAPKRIMRPRRQTDGGAIEDGGMPGTGVINLQNAQHLPMDGANSPTRGLLSQTPATPLNGAVQQQTSASAPPPTTSTTTTLTTGATAMTALTPPEDTLTQVQSRKRKHQGGSSASAAANALNASSLLETAPSPPLNATAPPVQAATSSPPKKRRASQNPSSSAAFSYLPPSGSNPTGTATSQGQTQQGGGGGGGAAAGESSSAVSVASLFQVPLLEEVLESIKSRTAPPRWREQALDIFFQEFSGEELDLQVKISENVLSNNENKAMVFCKMPPLVRQHWVGKFREMHQLNKTG